MSNFKTLAKSDLPLRTKYYLYRDLARARYAMAFPANKMTDRRRITLTEYIGYRDVHKTNDGKWMAKEGFIWGNGSSGVWGGIPSDSMLVKEAREKWSGKR